MYMEYATLINGVRIPVIGFGTYKAVAGEDKDVIFRALQVGYRHIDTAAFYNNEEIVRDSIARSGIPREEIFITSKLWKDSMGYRQAKESFRKSLERLGTDYLDLFLIHWPKSSLEKEDWESEMQETWRALEELYEDGKVRAIGVSNFLPHHLMTLMETAKIAPMVDQMEFHPGYMQKTAVDYCQQHDILVEGWSPIGRMRMADDPTVAEMADRYDCTVAQLCLRFCLQCHVVPLPKSSSEGRMRENLDVFDFEISQKDMSVLMTLPQLAWSGEHPDRERVYF